MELTGAVTADSACISTTRRTDRRAHYARRHTFTLDSPGWVTVDHTSSQLDPYLLLLQGHSNTGQVIAEDDNNGTRNNSRLADVFLQPGDYTIEATTSAPETAGTYTLTVNATITGLQPAYDAYAGRELVIEFETGPFVPTATVPASVLSATATKRGSTASLSVTPSLTGSFRVSLSFGRPAGTSTGYHHGAQSASVQAPTAFGSHDVGLDVRCDERQKPNPNPSPNEPGGRCVLRPERQLYDLLGRLGRYHVTPALLEGTKRVAAQALAAAPRQCRVRPARIAAAMMAIGFWEIPVAATAEDARSTNYEEGDIKRGPARSLMTLSRGDFHQIGAEGRNRVLYPDNLTNGYPGAGQPLRAFWHPGVGYWQLDFLEGAIEYNHAERASVDKGGLAVAKFLTNKYCDNGESGLRRAMARHWAACAEGQCYVTAQNIYLGYVTGTSREEFYVTTRDNTEHTSVTGGAHGGIRCRWGNSAPTFGCTFFDTDSYQGHAETDRPNGDRNPGTAISPYAAPFMSFTHADKKYAIFPSSFAGGRVTYGKYVPKNQAVRAEADNTWTSYVGDDTSALQVQICREYSGGSPGQPLCSWANTSSESFMRRMRAVYPDTNLGKDP